jgi:hypothetical protein
MTAVIYNFDRSATTGPADETERLLAALGRYTAAELLELLYVGEEPGFFDLMRSIFGLSEETRWTLQNFLKAATLQTITAEIGQHDRGVLTLKAMRSEHPVKGIAP